ncbi:translation initiation factor IF-2-like isoform X1 [Aquila chrysaetos chrysaetos]|uniref:translation initiation factor IF-2-like isoform X1 n=1 Tax=Aquila chrysaetos chrysaetos TaxID=223781 RepID=UPI0011767058|nr:translation initiation factor IF-2-like isoform X1 [Aquila chrysaetos chrysaetos]
MASGAARSQLAPGNRGRSAGSCRPDASALRQGRVGGATAAPGTCRAAEPAASGGGGAGRGGAGQPRCAATAPPRRLRCREGRRPAEGGAAHLPLASMRSRRPARGAAHLRLARRGSKMEAAARRGRVWCVHTGLRWLKRGFPPSPQAPQRVAPRDEAGPASGCAPSPRGATSPHLRALPQRWGGGSGSPPGLGGSQPRC